MGEQKITSKERIISIGVAGAAAGTVGYLMYRERQERKKGVDKFVRRECQGVDDDTYKRLANYLWERDPFSNIPLQFRVEDVQSMREMCQKAGGVPSTKPIPEPKVLEDNFGVNSPWFPRSFTEPSKAGLFDHFTNWVVDHEKTFQEAAVTVGGFVLMAAGALSLFVPGLQPVGVAAAAAGAALMMEPAPQTWY